MTDAQKSTVLTLRSKGMSFSKIAETVGLSVNTIKSFCSRHKGQFCLCCGEPITQPPRVRQKKFCSDKCRMKWWNAHIKDVNRKAMYDFICSNCGKPFQAYGNNHRKYCCHRCYILARFGVKKMDIQQEAMYQVTMGIVKKMFHANLISEDEYRQIDTMFREKYEPKIGTLFVDLEPEQR